jgi:hypothetical protein
VSAALFGTDLFGARRPPPASSVTAARFGVPPFTVLNAQAGDWQERKRAWVALGLKSDIGREANLLEYGDLSCLSKSQQAMSKTSIFDPVLAEMLVRWYAPPAGQVIDPFAGGSVRGIVSGALGRPYWGCDLRAEQVDANRAQAAAIPVPAPPVWVTGDARDALAGAPDADFMLTCPPYGDLERYSDDPADLSAMTWPDFLEAYRAIIAAAWARLRPDRFAAIVVGEIRCPRGLYRNFLGETVRAFMDAGAGYYNDLILQTMIGPAGALVRRQFTASRKNVKTHQNVLVFVKGDPRRATAACGDVDPG